MTTPDTPVDAPAPGQRRLTGDIAGQLVGQVFNIALGVVATLLIARTLGTAGFGEWSTVFAIVQIAGYLGDLGLEEVAIRQAAAKPEDESRWVGAVVSLHCALAIPTAVGCLAVTAALSESAQMTTTGLLISATVLVGAPTGARILFRLRTRNDRLTAILVVRSVIWTGAVIAVVITDGQMVALAAAFLGVAVVANTLEVVGALRLGRIALLAGRRLWGPLFRLALPLGVANLTGLVLGQIDQILVFRIAGRDDAGLYAAAYRIFTQASFVAVALVATLFPLVAAAEHHDLARVRQLVSGAGDVLAILAFPAVAFTLVEAQPLIEVLIGRGFAEADAALRILMVGLLPMLFGSAAVALLTALGLQGRLVRVAGVALVFNVLANLWAIPRFGVEGAAWVTVATEVLVLGLACRLMRGFALRLNGGRIARAAGAAAGMALVALVLERATPFAAVMLAAVVAYLLLLPLLGVVSRSTVTDLLAR